MLPRLYSRVPNSDRLDDVDILLRESHGMAQQSNKTLVILRASWCKSTILLVILLCFVIWDDARLRYHGSFQLGFDTEFQPLVSAIEVVKVKFTGTLRYSNSTHLFIDNGFDGTRYVGSPTPEVDKSWEDLVGPYKTFRASVKEAEALDINALENPVFGGPVGPDVLHTLHCVNEIRKVLDSGHYYNVTMEQLTRGHRIHIDHCLNHIRQYIQCHMDLTPTTSLYFQDANTEVGNFDQVHTCRDMKRLREWMAKRNRMPLEDNGLSVLGDTSGRKHQQGYLVNEESMLPWGYTESEFE